MRPSDRTVVRGGLEGGNEKSDHAEPFKTFEEVVEFACEQQESEMTGLARQCTRLEIGNEKAIVEILR